MRFTNKPNASVMGRKRPRRKADGALPPEHEHDSLHMMPMAQSVCEATFPGSEWDEPALRSLSPDPVGEPDGPDAVGGEGGPMTSPVGRHSQQRFGFAAKSEYSSIGYRLQHTSEQTHRAAEVHEAIVHPNRKPMCQDRHQQLLEEQNRERERLEYERWESHQGETIPGSAASRRTTVRPSTSGSMLGGASAVGGLAMGSRAATATPGTRSRVGLVENSLSQLTMGETASMGGEPMEPQAAPGSMPFYHHFSKRTLTRAKTADNALVCALREEQGSLLQNGYELRLREEDRRQHQRDRESGTRFQGFVRGKSNQTYATEVAVDQANMHGKSNQGLFGIDEPKPYKHQFRDDPRKGTKLWRDLPRCYEKTAPVEKLSTFRSTDGVDWNMLSRAGGFKLDRLIR